MFGTVRKILGGLLITFGFYLTFKDQTLLRSISDSEIQVDLLNYNYVIVLCMAVGFFLVLL